MRSRLGLAALLAGVLGFTAHHAAAQSQAQQIARMTYAVEDHARRISEVERNVSSIITTQASIQTDIAVLKDNMIQLKWIVQAVAGSFIGYLVVTGLSARKKTRPSPGE